MIVYEETSKLGNSLRNITIKTWYYLRECTKSFYHGLRITLTLEIFFNEMVSVLSVEVPGYSDVDSTPDAMARYNDTNVMIVVVGLMSLNYTQREDW